MPFSLHLYLGPMYAGKTNKLMSHVKDDTIVLDYIEKNVCEFGILNSHSNHSVECIKLHRLCDLFITKNTDILNKLKTANVILINEGQFFSDLFEFIQTAEMNTIQVEVFGLDGDFERKPFGQILRIIPYCDTVTKITGNCFNCEKKSLFSKRIIDCSEQYLADETAYRPVCRKCYHS